MEASSHFHDDIRLKILPTLRVVPPSRPIFYFLRKTFYKDRDDQFKELQNYKDNLVFCLSNIRDVSIALG